MLYLIQFVLLLEKTHTNITIDITKHLNCEDKALA